MLGDAAFFRGLSGGPTFSVQFRSGPQHGCSLGMNHKRVLAPRRGFRSITVACLAAFAALASVPSAQAAQIGFYIGGAYGQTEKDVVITDFDAYAGQIFDNLGFTVTSGASSVDDSFNGYGFYGGYRFTTHFGVEGGYFNLGSFKYRARVNGTIGGLPSAAAVNYDGETSGITVAAIGVWPLSYRWEVYGRAGALFASNTASVYYADVQGPLRDEFSENSVDLLAGIGTSLNFLEIYDLRLEYQRVFDAGDEVIGEGDADTISIGVSVMF
jgi:OOP family OmpA-OmpF porin